MLYLELAYFFRPRKQLGGFGKVGFYIRKGFNFGPLRLNLSRSGFGASVGVKGARIGLTPRGETYVHLGRGGLYYRQTLSRLHPHGSITPQYQPPALLSGGQLTEITSAAAQTIVDSSATDLLRELNIVKRRIDLFPVAAIVGILLLLRTIQVQADWWVGIAAVVALVLFAVSARHSDVTNNTVAMHYSLEGEAAESASQLRNVMTGFAACSKIWRVDAAGRQYDWKRNAGASYSEKRQQTHVSFGCPSKIVCNISVPILKAGRKSLYFFPDRLLVYDSSGVGAISYEDLQVRAGQTRFVETEYVPDATKVGSTWRFVNKNGGPDRRFNNNRELPIMLYGELSLTSSSGLNEWFQCSIPGSAGQVSAVVGGLKPVSAPGGIEVSFATPDKDLVGWTRVGLWSGIALMGVIVLLSGQPSSNSPSAEEQAVQAKLVSAQQQNLRKQQFATDLTQRLRGQHRNNIVVTAANDNLTLAFAHEDSKTARRDGLRPTDKKLIFARLLQPDVEATVCRTGFRTLRLITNDHPPNELKLDCPIPGP